MSTGAEPSEIIDDFQGAFTDARIACAIFAVVLYEQLITIYRAREFIWAQKFTYVTLMFHLNRWSLLTWSACLLISAFVNTSSLPGQVNSILVRRCYAMVVVYSAASIILFIISLVYTSVRVYALSFGSWRLTLTVMTILTVPLGLNIYALSVGFSLTLVISPGIGAACVPRHTISQLALRDLVSIGFSFSVVADILVLVLIWTKTYKLSREQNRLGIRSYIASSLLCNGTACFVIMTIMNIVNLATRLTNSFDEGGSVGTVVNSMMISRFLLSLRQAAYSTPDGAMDTLFSFGRASDGTDVPLPHSLHFASFVGNMGVELDWEADGEDRQESDFTVLPP